MTNRERVAIEHPERINPKSACGGVRGCPGDVGYPELPQNECHSDPESCTRCWDLENPNPIIAIVDTHVTVSADTPGIHDYGIVGEPGVSGEDGRPTIKDSGDRTRFESGAVRDMRTGKGRFDLIPLDVIAGYYERYSKTDGCYTIFNNLKNFMEIGDSYWLYLAIRNFRNLGAFADDETMFLEVAKHFEEGALKYGPDNWKKGIPTWCYIDSAARHYCKWLRGDRDEPHDRAFVWNLMCCIWEVDHHKTDEEEEPKIKLEYPCKNCNTGWGTVSSEDSDGCENYCERLAKYLEAQK